MYTNLNIVMTQKNKDWLLSRMHYSTPAECEMLRGMMGRIICVPDTEAAFTQAMEEYSPAILVMDLFVGKTDIVTYVKSAFVKPGRSRPVLVAMCEFISYRLERELYRSGIAAVISDATPPGTICSVLCRNPEAALPSSPAESGKQAPLPRTELELVITDILHKTGVPAHIKGYQYLRTAIILTVGDPDIINYVTKRLYPDVAEIFLTTPSRVERAMRHAIELAWDRGDVDFLGSYYGSTIHHSRGKPTNSEFIAIIADKVRISLHTI